MSARCIGRVAKWLAVWLALATTGCDGTDNPDVDVEDGDTGDVEADTGDVEPDAPPPPPWEALLELAQAQMDAQGIPGLQIVVVEDGEVAHVGALGARGLAGEGDVTNATVFRWPAASGLVTTAAVMRAVELGELDLDQAVVEVIPDFGPAVLPGDVGPMTLRHLLAGTSGLPALAVPWHGAECRDALADYYGAWTPALDAPAGSFYRGTVHERNLLGLAVEIATNRPFEQAAADLVLTPLGMDGATFDAADAVQGGDYAWGHHPGAAAMRLDEVDCLAMRPSLFLHATASDIGEALVMALDGDGVLTPEDVAALYDMGDTGMRPDGSLRASPFALYDPDWRGVGLLESAAVLAGFQDTLALVPSRGFAVGVVANTYADLTPITRRAIDLWFPELPPDTRDFSTEPSTWDVYTGTYESPTLGSMAVTLDGDTLSVQIGATKHEFRQVGGNVFAYTGGESPLWFAFTPGAPDHAQWLLGWFDTGTRSIAVRGNLAYYTPPASLDDDWERGGFINGMDVCLFGRQTGHSLCTETGNFGVFELNGVPANSPVAFLMTHPDYLGRNLLMRVTGPGDLVMNEIALVRSDDFATHLAGSGCTVPPEDGTGTLYIGAPPGSRVVITPTPANAPVYMGADGTFDPVATEIAASLPPSFAAAVVCGLAPGWYEIDYEQATGTCHRAEGWPSEGHDVRMLVAADTFSVTSWVCH